jgi:hypothetical protein
MASPGARLPRNLASACQSLPASHYLCVSAEPTHSSFDVLTALLTARWTRANVPSCRVAERRLFCTEQIGHVISLLAGTLPTGQLISVFETIVGHEKHRS